MSDYNFALFNAVTDAIAALEAVKDALVKAQQAAEEAYLERPALLVLPRNEC